MAAHHSKNIIVFGATGLIGEHITNAILDHKDKFGKIGIFTSSNTLWTKSEEIDHLKERGVEVISGELTSADAVKEAYNGFDTVVSCVGRSVIHQQLQLIQLAEQHPDIKRFFPSEYGTDIEHGPASANEKPHQQKLKVRAALEDVKNLEYTYVVTGPYGDADRGLFLSAVPAEQEAMGTFDVGRKRAVLLGDGTGKVSLTTMRDVGKFVAAALLHPDAARNKALRVNSFTATPKQIAAEFEKQTGESWELGFTSLEELKRIEKQAWASNDPRAGPMTLRRIWTEGGTLYDERDNGLIEMEGGKVDSLASAVKLAIGVQGKTA